MIRDVQTATPTLSRGDSLYREEGTFPQLSSWGGVQQKNAFIHHRSSASGSCKRDIWISVSPGCPDYTPLHTVLCPLRSCSSSFWCCGVIGCISAAEGHLKESSFHFHLSNVWHRPKKCMVALLIRRCSDVTSAVYCASNSWWTNECKW